MKYTKEMRDRISKDCVGKVVDHLVWEDGDEVVGGYWIMTFTDGTECCFRFMAELETA